MDKTNEIQYEQLEALIEKLIENKVYEMLNNFGIETVSPGKITSLDKTRVDSEGNITEVVRASVKLPDGTIVANLYNATGQVLSVGDEVKIYGSRTNMSNRYIGIKYEGEVF